MKSIPKISLLVLGILSLIIGVLFYVTGENGSIEVGGETIGVPVYTDALIYWTYFLMVLSVVVTLGILLFQYFVSIKTDPKTAVKSLIAVGFLALILVISYFAGSADKMEIVGYEGTDNSGFWAQFTDMCLYSMYTLMGAAFVAIIGTGVYKQIKR
jgi:hypothetical protein